MINPKYEQEYIQALLKWNELFCIITIIWMLGMHWNPSIKNVAKWKTKWMQLSLSLTNRILSFSNADHRCRLLTMLVDKHADADSTHVEPVQEVLYAVLCVRIYTMSLLQFQNSLCNRIEITMQNNYYSTNSTSF